MVRVEGKVRGYIKEKIKCNICSAEQVSLYPYQCDKLECHNCGNGIPLYSHYINSKNQIVEVPNKYEAYEYD
jgi:ribosomal protein S27E